MVGLSAFSTCFYVINAPVHVILDTRPSRSPVQPGNIIYDCFLVSREPHVSMIVFTIRYPLVPSLLSYNYPRDSYARAALTVRLVRQTPDHFQKLSAMPDHFWQLHHAHFVEGCGSQATYLCACTHIHSVTWQQYSYVNRRQQSLKEAFGACGKKMSAVENYEVASKSDLQLSSSDSDIADHPDLCDDTQESEVAHDLLFSSGASASVATVNQAGDEQVEFELLDKPHQPRSGVFLKRQFGQKKPEYRSFKPNWLDSKLWCSWLHWESGNNRAYCFICRNVYVCTS